MEATNQVVIGKVVQVAGPAVDCEFPEGKISIISPALEVAASMAVMRAPCSAAVDSASDR